MHPKILVVFPVMLKMMWHKSANLWCKVIGKRLDSSRTRLVQAQHYFTADRQDSEAMAMAMALKQEWVQLKRTWKVSLQSSLSAD